MKLASVLAACAVLALAACAGFESAGRSSEASAGSALPPPVESAAIPAPAAAAPLPPPPTAITPAPSQAEAAPSAPAIETRPVRAANNNEIIVPGTRQIRPPHGDPRTQTERMADIRAWDRCVMRVHNLGESDPTKPQLEDPEDYCRRALGMSNRTAVPDNRQP